MTKDKLIEKYRQQLIVSREYKETLSNDFEGRLMAKFINTSEQLIEGFIEDLKKLSEAERN